MVEKEQENASNSQKDNFYLSQSKIQKSAELKSGGFFNATFIVILFRKITQNNICNSF